MRAVPFLAAAALALAAGACAAPPAKTTAGGTVSGGGERAAAPAGQSWWQRITRPRQEPGEKPWVYGDVRPGKGLLGTDEGFVLYRKGEAGRLSDSDKPAKVRR